MTALIHARGLIRHFGDVRAVDGIDLDIRTGQCLGLLGPNGAGKTTVTELLEGIKQPTFGEILYRDEPLGERFHNEAGIMFQNTALPDFITTREALTLFAGLYRHTLPLDQVVRDFALGEFLDRDTRKLSGGQRQRVLLAIALINDPAIVFLDEPTTGLDPQARRRFWELIRSIKAQGKTILLTTHYMEEAYVLCDEIAIMDHGRIIAQGTPRALLSKHFRDAVVQLPRADAPATLAGIAGELIESGDEFLEILTRDVNSTVRQLLDRGASLANLQIRQRTLEDLFLELTGKELRA
jgi:ABC-2 type transport system ATP-binding protein